MSQDVIVPQEDVSAAYDHFIDMFFPKDHGMGLHFWAFVGLEKTPHTGGNWAMPEEAARLVKMLAGPHHHAVAKVMLVKGHQYKIPIGMF